MAFLWIFIVSVSIIFLLDRLIGRMYRYKITPHQVTPEKYGLAFTEIHIPAARDAQLYGWWIPASPDAPTLILIHGWGRNLARMMPYIRALHPMGYNLLAFDARNHGSSAPIKHPTVGTFSEDILSALDFAIRSDWVSPGGIGIVGLSVGGGAAVNAAGWDDRVKSVITVGAISHPAEVMRLEFQKRKIPNFIPWLLFQYMRFRFGMDFEKIAPVNNISHANADILLIQGAEDATVPITQGQALAEAGDAERTHLWIVPDMGHSNCNTHPLFWERVHAFLQETLPVS
jgi:pimeloyl-ACP methyl ester carboxylesterase